MKRIILLVTFISISLTTVLISLSLTACGQPGNIKKVKINNRIDSLYSEKEVFAFVKQQVHGFKGQETFSSYRNETAKVADSLKVKHWVKADIDNNGETDLLLFGANGLPAIYAILSAENTFKTSAAKYHGKYQFIYPVIAMVREEPVLLLYSQDQTGYDNQNKRFTYTPLSVDTLVIKDGLFLNYVFSPVQYDIERIEISNDGVCEGNCPRIYTVIDAKKLSSHSTHEMYWDNKPKITTGQLTPAQVKKILSILQYSNFAMLKEQYTINITDQPQTTLTITYNNGLKKTIKDNGSSGTFTLAALYGIAYDIEWK